MVGFMARETGVVKWFNDEKGFGFVTSDAGGADALSAFEEFSI